MAAPATYIRTIHSSLTSASAHHSHHTPSAWASASAASASAQYHLNHGHHHLHTLTTPISNAPIVSGGHPVPYHHQPRHAPNQVSYGAQGLMHTPSISTHNAHMYTHHLRDLTHPSSPSSPPSSVSHHRASGAQGPTMVMNQQGPYIPASGNGDAAQVPHHPQHAPLVAPRRNPPSPPPHSRRRSASIRMAPSYRFDPFGDVDESLGASGVTGFSSSGGGGMSLSAEVAPSEPEAMAEQEDDIGSFSQTSNQPYTIHIPPAAPTEIQQYTPQPQLPRTPSPAARSLPPLSPGAASSSSSPPVSVPKLSSSASALGLTYAPTTPATSHSFPAPNLSKIVAGMMLNRVHTPKPMRRRVVGGGRQYVKSCLSSVVSVEV